VNHRPGACAATSPTLGDSVRAGYQTLRSRTQPVLSPSIGTGPTGLPWRIIAMQPWPTLGMLNRHDLATAPLTTSKHQCKNQISESEIYGSYVEYFDTQVRMIWVFLIFGTLPHLKIYTAYNRVVCTYDLVVYTYTYGLVVYTYHIRSYSVKSVFPAHL
jgi:hypothetical protein